jgi:uncharacterized membrane protein (UPF0127 family)
LRRPRGAPSAPLLALLLALAGPAGIAGAAGKTSLTLPSGDTLAAEVMVSDDERHRGLMARASLPADTLMLFAYPDDGVHHVWMKGCRFPIDVAWLDAAGTVVWVEEGLPPCAREPCPIFGPEASSRYFVEGIAGWTKARGVAVGAHVGVGKIEPAP